MLMVDEAKLRGLLECVMPPEYVDYIVDECKRLDSPTPPPQETSIIGAKCNDYEYAFLTNTWKGRRGAAYNACAEYCKERGWYHELTTKGRPVLTKLGHLTVNMYQGEQSRRKSEAH